jgi:hypothetical protein
MKTCRRLATAFALMAVMFLSTSPPMYAQKPDSPTVVKTDNPDSALKSKDSVILKTSDSTVLTVPTSTITAPDEYTIFGMKLPTWANWIVTMLLALIVVLPGIQYVLKRIPGAAPIDNWLGKVLNVLTWFQDNIVHPNQTLRNE